MVFVVFSPSLSTYMLQYNVSNWMFCRFNFFHRLSFKKHLLTRIYMWRGLKWREERWAWYGYLYMRECIIMYHHLIQTHIFLFSNRYLLNTMNTTISAHNYINTWSFVGFFSRPFCAIEKNYQREWDKVCVPFKHFCDVLFFLYLTIYPFKQINLTIICIKKLSFWNFFNISHSF